MTMNDTSVDHISAFPNMGHFHGGTQYFFLMFIKLKFFLNCNNYVFLMHNIK